MRLPAGLSRGCDPGASWGCLRASPGGGFGPVIGRIQFLRDVGLRVSVPGPVSLLIGSSPNGSSEHVSQQEGSHPGLESDPVLRLQYSSHQIPVTRSASIQGEASREGVKIREQGALGASLELPATSSRRALLSAYSLREALSTYPQASQRAMLGRVMGGP